MKTSPTTRNNNKKLNNLLETFEQDHCNRTKARKHHKSIEKQTFLQFSVGKSSYPWLESVTNVCVCVAMDKGDHSDR